MDIDKHTALIFKGILVILTSIHALLAFTDIWAIPSYVEYALLLIRLAVIWFIIQDGSILKSRFYSIVLFICIAFIVIGAWFKIMYWYPANYLLLTGLSSTILFYTIWFVQKPTKKSFDIIKWLWVLSSSVVASCIIFHWYNGEIFRLLPTIFFLVLMSAYLRIIMKDLHYFSKQ